VLREAGHKVYATDLVDRGCPDSQSRVDFLLEHTAPPVDCILTNPPFALAEKFITHALTLSPCVIMFQRLAFLASAERVPLFTSGRFARLHVLCPRVPMMHRENWNGPRTNSGIDCGWFVWDAKHGGPPQINHLLWRQP
jgi:hypothetical protein